MSKIMSRGGRPPLIPGAAATAVIYIRVTPDVAADLLRVAEDNHTSRAEVIREAVNEYVLDYRERVIFPITRLSTRSCQ